MHWTDDFLQGGDGAPVLLVHGWPFHNQCFRKITPALEKQFTWYAFNAIGMNAASFDRSTDFSLTAHAMRLIEFADARGLDQFQIVAHNTGATVSRIAAAEAPERITNLVLLNTEIPGHRPPFIPFYQNMTRLPGSRLLLTFLLRQRWFNRSAMGFGGSFDDISKMDAEFTSTIVDRWVKDRKLSAGYIRYLQGIDWGTVDRLHQTHQAIRCPVNFVWGKHDRTFPVSKAREMAAQIPTCQSFTEIENTCFLLHEERPEEVSEAVMSALVK